MQDLAWTWSFLLDRSPEPYLVPAPWHLLLVLFVLGLLAAAGLHHLAGFTYGLYRIRSRATPWLALPTLAVLLISLQVLLAAYLLGSQGGAVVRVALSTSATAPSVLRIGRLLLEPAFADAGPEPMEVEVDQLRRSLTALSADDFRGRLRRRLDSTREALSELAAQRARERNEGLAPEQPADPPRAEPSPHLEALALRWAIDPGQSWPVHPPLPSQGAPAEREPPHDGRQPTPEVGAGNGAGNDPGNGAENAGQGTAQSAVENAAGGGLDSAGEPPAGDPAPPRPQASGPERETGERTFPLSRFVASLVAEIRPGMALARRDWEDIAGHRFFQWVLEPELVRQVRQTALLAAAVVVAVNFLYFFLLIQLRRWLPRPGRGAGAARPAHPRG